MGTRADSIDLLRGLAIVGMVLSGQTLWHSDLPAWMFHAQVPPPDFRFDPSVPGITWVALVFPFFLFSMGAAFPLALRRKLELKGESVAAVVLGIVQRWALLALFAIALANLRPGVLGVLPEWAAALVQLAAWGCFGALFLRLDRLSPRQNRTMHACGLAGLLLLMAGAKWLGGAKVSVHNSDIIILVLANMALAGSLTWLATRNSIRARMGVLALLVAVRLGTEVDGSWNQALWNWSPVPWLFRFDYLKYLCLILPGTIAGELFWQRMQQQQPADSPQTDRQPHAALVVAGAAALVAVNMWGLFTRHLTINLAASVVLGLALRALLRRNDTPTGVLHRRLFDWGLFWLVLGLCLEAFEGGIKKDHATLSYFFVTSGLASCVLIAANTAMRQWGVRFGALVKCGRNPMVAYTAAGFLLMPLLTLTHTAPWLQRLAEISPWMGVVRGALVTAAVMGITVLFTNKRLFWRT